MDERIDRRRIRKFVIVEQLSPAFGGRSFGNVGQYESLKGYVVGEVDPHHPLNAGIALLDKAERNARGLVEYKADVTILQPVDKTRRNNWLFYEVLNRGDKRALERLNGSAGSRNFEDLEDAGNGHLMRQGYTLAWAGWQSELGPVTGLMTARFPVAREGGRPMTGLSVEEFINEDDGTCFIGQITYPPADARGVATLTVRQRQADPRVALPATHVRFLDDRRVEIMRGPAELFDKGAIYELQYEAKDPIVCGLAFAATRDIGSWLRYGEPGGIHSPLRSDDAVLPAHAMIFGVSQSGRFVRDFLYLGLNEDLAGRKAFDGAMPAVCGSRKTFINFPFGQPGRFQRQHEDHCFPGDQFPFTYVKIHDPISGKTDGILERALASGTCPKVMHLDTDSDLWAARFSLLVTDCEGNDIMLPPYVRVYLGSGLRHSVHNSPEEKRRAKSTINELDYGWLGRALVEAMRRWVEEGIEPPASQYPTVASGTLVSLKGERELSACSGL